MQKIEQSKNDSQAHYAYDVLIVGSGAAGMSLALQLPSHYQIGLLSKGPLTEANTYYAQGGVAAVIDGNDSVAAHIDDTINAGAGLCDADSVAQIINAGPWAIDWLTSQGVIFTPDHDQVNASNQPMQPYHLTLLPST